MIYEFKCPKGHVTEHHVKLNGEGTPTSCIADVIEAEGGGPLDLYKLVAGTQRPAEPRRCGAALTRILSLGSPYFPGAGSWRGR